MSEIPGMNEGIEAVRILFQGFELLIRTGTDAVKWSMENLIKFASFMWRLHESKKTDLKEGEVQFADLSKMGDTALIQVKNENKEHIINYLQQAGLTYSILPDLNNEDDSFEIAYLGSQDVAIQNYIAKFPDMARTYTYAEYEKNSIDEITEKVLPQVVKDSNSMVKSIVEENINDKWGYVLQNGGFPLEINTSLVDKTDMLNFSKEKVKVAVPNQKDMYILVSKHRFCDSNDMQHFKIAFKPNETFELVKWNGEKILDNNGNVKYVNAENYEGAVKNMKKAVNGKTENDIYYFSNIDKNGVKTSLSKVKASGEAPIIDIGDMVKTATKGKKL